MKIIKIDFIRNFNLNEENIVKIIENYGNLGINDNILLNFSDIKKSLSLIELKSESNVFRFSHPLGDFKKIRGNYIIYVGDKKLTTLRPQYFKMAKSCPEKFGFEIDETVVSINKASDFFVNDDFKVLKSKNLRVNVIGYRSKNLSDESGIRIALKNLSKRFSVDKQHKVYRVEFYNNNEFCSMSMVHFK